MSELRFIEKSIEEPKIAPTRPAGRERIRRRRFSELKRGAIVRVRGHWGVVIGRGVDFWDVGDQPLEHEIVDVLEREPRR